MVPSYLVTYTPTQLIALPAGRAPEGWCLGCMMSDTVRLKHGDIKW